MCGPQTCSPFVAPFSPCSMGLFCCMCTSHLRISGSLLPSFWAFFYLSDTCVDLRLSCSFTSAITSPPASPSPLCTRGIHVCLCVSVCVSVDLPAMYPEYACVSVCVCAASPSPLCTRGIHVCVCARARARVCVDLPAMYPCACVRVCVCVLAWYVCLCEGLGFRVHICTHTAEVLTKGSTGIRVCLLLHTRMPPLTYVYVHKLQRN